MIYKLKYDFENSALISIDGLELAKKMPSLRPKFFAQPKAQRWVEPEATLYRSEHFKGDVLIAPDVSIWSTGVLTLNAHAYKVLQPSLAKAGEFLPLSIDGEQYYLFNILYIVPDVAIDKENAVDVIDSGVHYGLDNVAFNEEYLSSNGILVFKTNTDRLLHSYCTSTFKELYENKGFKGMRFDPIVMK